LAAERSVWVAGVVVGGVVVRREVVWPVSVVVAVDMGTWDLLRELDWKDRPRSSAAARAGKSHWLATVFGAEDGRLATEATKEPSTTKKGSRGRKMLVKRRVERSPLIKVELMASYASRTHCSRLPLPTALGHSEQGYRWGWGDVWRYPLISIERRRER
jgi:hypothetical protein